MSKAKSASLPVTEAVQAIESAQEDFDTLSDVFSWLARLFFEIDQKCKDVDSVEQMLQIGAVKTLAEIGNYLAVSWGATAESMKGSLGEAIVEHRIRKVSDLQLTAQALPRSVSPSGLVRTLMHEPVPV